jgi:hypothetical protein
VTEPLSRERLEEIHEREKKATRGPWEAFDTEDHWSLHVQGVPCQILKAPKRNTPYAEYWPYKEDADFIVHAREDVRDLLIEVMRLRALYGPAEEWWEYQTCGDWGVTAHETEEQARADAASMLRNFPRSRARVERRLCWRTVHGTEFVGLWEVVE